MTAGPRVLKSPACWKNFMLKTGCELSSAEITRRYDDMKTLGLGPEFTAMVIDFADDIKGTVLDAGCGNCDLLLGIAKFSGVKLFGVDISIRPENPDRFPPEITLKKADIQERIPFEDNFFDIVFCSETIEHLRHPEMCLSEIKRVLKKNGRLILTVPNGTSYFPFVRFGLFIPTKWLRSNLLPYEHPLNTSQPVDTCYDYGEILALVRGCGFKIERMKGWRYFRYLQTLPLVRVVYGVVYPAVEKILSALGLYRFAYNLFISCRVSQEGTYEQPH